MGSILLLLSFFGCWLVISSILNWDWSFGTFDLYPVENAFGIEAVRWGILSFGLLMMFIGFGGCN